MSDTTQMLKGILDGCLLAIINEGEIYGYELAAKLESYGFHSLSEGTIYPLLLRMQKEGLISATLRKSTAGPKRKYYTLTEKGERELELFIGRWEQVSSSVDNVLNKKGDMKNGLKGV
ncbi:PadR family transcriptional regulator [Cytobacillus oceanisediminis]|uniref:PadR family transcriptional regulator n=1 Tax=Cytobacillus oceanisediminis TaxID=665099 RepID=UPI0024955AA7|nr:PadR family transcriptional regulator [Cytobacillus oceanisediminis]